MHNSRERKRTNSMLPIQILPVRLNWNLNRLTWLMLACLLGCRDSQPIEGVVVGASMAPTLLPDHWEIACVDCRYSFPLDVSPTDNQSPKLVCPNCGCPLNGSEGVVFRPAQRLEIHPIKDLARWDIAAFQVPGGSTIGIKRVVGLPAEVLQFRGGDLFADQQLLRKPWPIQIALRIPIFDSSYQPANSAPNRWRPRAVKTNWSTDQDVWKYEIAKDILNSENQITSNTTGTRPAPPTEVREPGWEWLVYHHWRCCAHRGSRDDEFPIEDIDTFNSSLGRNLNPMDDIFLELKCDVAANAQLGWRFHRGLECFEFRIDTACHQLLVATDSSAENPAQFRTVVLPSHLFPLRTIEFSSFDAQLMVRINGVEVLAESLEPVYQPGVAPVLEIGAALGFVRLEQIRLWRDIYYLDVTSTDQTLSAETGRYLLLGDNVPVSIDSRQWRNGGIPRKSMIGTVRSPQD